mmetsp:Transcript_13701/g.18997  ORF Transcript_13701/g.18997 Transcript_13701/m.18997 type:complete len:86 (+) Transcript_13701:615-872(+)
MEELLPLLIHVPEENVPLRRKPKVYLSCMLDGIACKLFVVMRKDLNTEKFEPTQDWEYLVLLLALLQCWPSFVGRSVDGWFLQLD